VELSYRPEFAEDVKALPTEGLKRAALKRLFDIKNGKTTGVELEWHPATGDLRDCYKSYFDDNAGLAKPAYRLVYRLLPTGLEAVEIEAVAVGERHDLAVYRAAAARLGRLPQ
jgi:hypothetical protein